MKYFTCLFILLLTLTVPLLSHAEDKPLCEQYTCMVQWDWKFGYGYSSGGGGGGVPAGGDALILEIGDNLLLEIGNNFLME